MREMAADDDFGFGPGVKGLHLQEKQRKKEKTLESERKALLGCWYGRGTASPDDGAEIE